MIPDLYHAVLKAGTAKAALKKVIRDGPVEERHAKTIHNCIGDLEIVTSDLTHLLEELMFVPVGKLSAN